MDCVGVLMFSLLGKASHVFISYWKVIRLPIPNLTFLLQVSQGIIRWISITFFIRVSSIIEDLIFVQLYVVPLKWTRLILTVTEGVDLEFGDIFDRFVRSSWWIPK